ncbi:hypothetical protein GW17_00053400 [Ensete ventricosum]|nr:hypothetical protein GW17_00053400 [Ensete ventricosum]
MDSLICPFDGKGRSCGEVELVELCVYAVISVKRIGTAKLQEGIFAFDGGSRNKGTKEPEDLWGGVVVLIRRPKRKKTAKRGREFSISPAGVTCVWGLCIYWSVWRWRLSLYLKRKKKRSRSNCITCIADAKAELLLLLCLYLSLCSHRMNESNRRHCNRRRWRPEFAGEIVEVPGGHIVRSTGRKDRHSKVYTAKGLRDRRVRLSAHTAIQFYDVQDRLGYDRPSKAVDWLIQNAKAAIDQLTELPCHHAPAYECIGANEQPMQAASDGHNSIEQSLSDAKAVAPLCYGFPSSFDSKTIDDTIRPFPCATAAASSPSTHAMTYRHDTPDLPLHTGCWPQDLRLSLQSFHEPIFQEHHPCPDSTQQSFLSGTTGLAQGATSVTCPVNKEMMVWWNAGNTSDGSGGEFMCSAALPPQSAALHLVNSQFQMCTQREPLQSSYFPSFRAWRNSTTLHPSLVSTVADAFVSESYSGFSGFNIPTRIEGEEQHNGIATIHSASPQDYKLRVRDDANATLDF